MRNPTFAGIVSRPRRALNVAAVAGLAGLGLAQAAQAAGRDAAAPIATAPPADSTEVSTVKIDAKRVADPSSSKFTAPLVDTPKSVTVIPSKIIEQTAATSLQDILRTSPGITFGAGEGGNPWPTVRSFAAKARATTSSSTACATAAAKSARCSTSSRSRS